MMKKLLALLAAAASCAVAAPSLGAALFRASDE